MKLIKTILLINLILQFSIHSYAQRKVKVNKQEFKTEQDVGFPEAWKHIKEGDKLFKKGKGTYKEAREHYLFAYQYNSENAELNYKIGVCYLYTDDKFESINYLRKAYVSNQGISRDIHFQLGRAYHLTLEFDKAINQYTEHKNSLSPKELVLEKSGIDKLIEECNNGKILVVNPLRIIITNMGENINSTKDDYYSIFAANDSVMFYTSRRQHNEKSKRSKLDNKFFEDIYISYNNQGEWGQAQNMGKVINSKNHNSAALSLSPDGKQLYIYRGYRGGGNIFISRLKENVWTSPRALPGKFNTKYRETSISFSPDNNQVFFVSDNEKDSYGGKDIFFTEKNEEDKWNKPVNMGDVINTPYNEEGVFISPDGNTLYFSSKGHNSMGGYDIFKTVRDDLGEWSEPENLGYPVNTADDDIFYSVSPGGKYAFYSAIRAGGIGSKDIYRVFFLGEEKEMVMSTEDLLIAGILDSTKTGFFILPDLLTIDTSYVLVGKVYDITSSEGVTAKLDFIDVDASKVIATTISKETGAYTVNLPEGKAYGVEIIARDYMFFLDIVDISGESAEEEIIRNFGLEKVEVGATVVLENIFFETNKATLKPESYIQLEQVLKFLQGNPTLRMEISGHTDNTGSLKYNTKLSRSRAEAVVNYLTGHGIGLDRLDAKGYAFSQPIATNDTPEGRARNRRVEFKILSK